MPTGSIRNRVVACGLFYIELRRYGYENISEDAIREIINQKASNYIRELFDNYLKYDLPILMGYGRVLDDGLWLGDIVGVANEMPDGYKLLKEIHLDW